jgi:hypothetical protein
MKSPRPSLGYRAKPYLKERKKETNNCQQSCRFSAHLNDLILT